MSKNTPCPRCGKNNPAEIHTCTPKQDQSIDPNSRQPMDGDAIHEGFEATGLEGINFTFRAFVEGVRWAEEYHGIGGEDD